MGIYDLSLKQLFEDNPADLVAVALGPHITLDAVELRPTETRIVERKADHLARVRAGGQEFLFLPEFKASYEADIDEQMFTYVSRASILHGFAAVWPVVFYLRDENYPREAKTAYERSLFGRSVCQVPFQEVRLFEWSARQVVEARAPAALLALVAMMRGAEPELVRHASSAIEEVKRPAGVKRNLQAVLAILSQQVFPDLDVSALIPREVYEMSTIYQQAIDEGIARGIAKGRAEGRLQAVLPLLESKLGRRATKKQKQQIAEAPELVLQGFIQALASAQDRQEALQAFRSLEQAGEPTGRGN